MSELFTGKVQIRFVKGKKDKIGRWKKLIACLKTVFGISIFVFLNKKKILLTTKKLFSIFE